VLRPEPPVKPMPRDIIREDAGERIVETQRPSRLKKVLGDLAVLAYGFLFVLAALAFRMHSIWLH
jgi:hypothetical protein